MVYQNRQIVEYDDLSSPSKDHAITPITRDSSNPFAFNDNLLESTTCQRDAPTDLAFLSWPPGVRQEQLQSYKYTGNRKAPAKIYIVDRGVAADNPVSDKYLAKIWLLISTGFSGHKYFLVLFCWDLSNQDRRWRWSRHLHRFESRGSQIRGRERIGVAYCKSRPRCCQRS